MADRLGFQHGDTVTVTTSSDAPLLTLTLLDEVGSGADAVVRAAWRDPDDLGADTAVPRGTVVAARLSPLPDDPAALAVVSQMLDMFVANPFPGVVTTYTYGQAPSATGQRLLVVVMEFVPFTLRDAVQKDGEFHRDVTVPGGVTWRWTLQTKPDGFGDATLTLLKPMADLLAAFDEDGIYRRDGSPLNTGIRENGTVAALDLEHWVQVDIPGAGYRAPKNNPDRAGWLPPEHLIRKPDERTYSIGSDAWLLGLEFGYLAIGGVPFPAMSPPPATRDQQLDLYDQQMKGQFHRALDRNASSVREFLGLYYLNPTERRPSPARGWLNRYQRDHRDSPTAFSVTPPAQQPTSTVTPKQDGTPGDLAQGIAHTRQLTPHTRGSIHTTPTPASTPTPPPAPAPKPTPASTPTPTPPPAPAPKPTKVNACPSWMQPRAAVIHDETPGTWTVLDVQKGDLRVASNAPSSLHKWQTVTPPGTQVRSVAAVDCLGGGRFVYVVTSNGDVLSARIDGGLSTWQPVWTAKDRKRRRDGKPGDKAVQVTAATAAYDETTVVVVIRTADGELWQHHPSSVTAQSVRGWTHLSVWKQYVTDVHAIRDGDTSVTVVGREKADGALHATTLRRSGVWGYRRGVNPPDALGPGGEYTITTTTKNRPKSTTVTQSFGNKRTGTAEGVFAALLPDGTGFLTQTPDSNYLLTTWGNKPTRIPRQFPQQWLDAWLAERKASRAQTGSPKADIPASRTAKPTKTTGDDHTPPPNGDIPASRAAVSAPIPAKSTDGVAPTPKVDEKATAEPTPAKSGRVGVLGLAIALLLVVVAGVALDLKFGFLDGWLGRGSDAAEKGQGSSTVDPATAQQMTEQTDFRTDVYGQTLDEVLPGGWGAQAQSPTAAGTLPVLSASTTDDCYAGQRCVTVRVMARLDERVPAAQDLSVDGDAESPYLLVRGDREVGLPPGSPVAFAVKTEQGWVDMMPALLPTSKTNAYPTRWDAPGVKPGHTVGDPDGPGSRLTFILPNGATIDDVVGLIWGLDDNRQLVTTDVAAALVDPSPRLLAGACFADTPSPGQVPDDDPVPCDSPHATVVLGAWPSNAVSDAGLTLHDLANPTDEQRAALFAVLGPDQVRCDTAMADLLGSDFPSRFEPFLRYGVDGTGTPVARCHLNLLSRDETSQEPLPADVTGSLATADGRWRYSRCTDVDPSDSTRDVTYTYCRAGVDIRFASTRTHSGSPAPPYPGEAVAAEQANRFCMSQNASGVWAAAPPRETWTFGSYDCWMPVDKWREMEGLPPLT